MAKVVALRYFIVHFHQRYTEDDLCFALISANDGFFRVAAYEAMEIMVAVQQVESLGAVPWPPLSGWKSLFRNVLVAKGNNTGVFI